MNTIIKKQWCNFGERCGTSVGALWELVLQGQVPGTTYEYNTISYNSMIPKPDYHRKLNWLFLTNDEAVTNKVRRWSTQAEAENTAWYQHPSA